MENLEKRITVGQEKFDKKECANLCREKTKLKEITMLKNKSD